LIPVCRAYYSMSYYGQSIYLFGGMDNNGDYLGDLWTINVASPQPEWTQISQSYSSDLVFNLENTPNGEAFTAGTMYTNVKPYFFIYGGDNSTNSSTDIWAYDINLNVWNMLVAAPLSTQIVPSANKGMTLTAISTGVVLIGGYSSTGQSSPSYSITLSTLPWIYNQNTCQITISTLGSCYWGQARCISPNYGSDCSLQLCPNSFCYQDQNLIMPAECFVCSFHGQCVGGVCQCEVGYTGPDCSLMACQNNCSNTATSVVSQCIEFDPVSVCSCVTSTKRGGDDCSNIFCLNDCGGHGVCDSTGACQCTAPYTGTDCSLLIINIYGGTLVVNFLVLVLFVLHL